MKSSIAIPASYHLQFDVFDLGRARFLKSPLLYVFQVKQLVPVLRRQRAARVAKSLVGTGMPICSFCFSWTPGEYVIIKISIFSATQLIFQFSELTRFFAYFAILEGRW